MISESMFNFSGENLTNWNDLPEEFKKEYISFNMGELGTNNSTATFMSTFYGVLLLLGIPGNVMTILIIYFNSNMRTPTDFFLLNLAVTDLITLTTGMILWLINSYYGTCNINYAFLVPVLPLEVMLLWKPIPWTLGAVGCHIMTVLSEVVAYVSVLTMLAFTYERYLKKFCMKKDKSIQCC